MLSKRVAHAESVSAFASAFANERRRPTFYLVRSRFESTASRRSLCSRQQRNTATESGCVFLVATAYFKASLVFARLPTSAVHLVWFASRKLEGATNTRSYFYFAAAAGESAGPWRAKNE